MPTDDADSSSQDPKADSIRERFGRGLRQTWELELVISGAVAFALLQLPSAVDRAFERLDPHMAETLQDAVFIVYYYSTLALYTMIATFLIHLVARAYWVGLIGLEAVFPQGVQWDKVTSGPVTKKYYAERLPPLKSLIEKTDNVCSMIFSFSFMVLFIFVLSILWAGVLGLVALLISRLLFDGERLGDIFRALMLILLVPIVLVGPLDKAIGGKLNPAGRVARSIRAITAFYYRALFMDLYAPIMMILFNNVKKKTIYPLFAAALAGVLGFFFLSVMNRGGLYSFDSDIYMPGKPIADEVSPSYYEDQRTEGEVFRSLPSIQSDVVRDPYIKLFIPYYPRRHNPALARRCPDVKPLREEGLRFEGPNATAPPNDATRRVLQCLARIHRVSLDGRPVAGGPFHFATHPTTGVRGIMAYVPTAGLSPGSHLLRVEAVPRPEPRKGEGAPDPYWIRFWV
jgi:hypothetical protein